MIKIYDAIKVKFAIKVHAYVIQARHGVILKTKINVFINELLVKLTKKSSVTKTTYTLSRIL